MLSWLKVVIAAVKGMIRDRCGGLGAALSYFALLAIPSFVVVVLSLTSMIFGEKAIQTQLLPFVRQRLDPWEAELLKYLMTQYQHFDWTELATNLIGLAVFLFGATEFTSQLKDSLETVWGKRVQGTGFKEYLSDQFTGFTIAVLMVIYFAVSIGTRIRARAALLAVIPRDYVAALRPFVDHAYSGFLVMIFTAILFKYFARSHLRWRHVWSGAFVTALLCALGRLGVTRYLAREDVVRLTGSGGAILIFLIWSFYFSQIFLFGAQITHALQRRRQGLPIFEKVEFETRKAA